MQTECTLIEVLSDAVEGATVFTFELLNVVADVQFTNTDCISTHTGLIPDLMHISYF